MHSSIHFLIGSDFVFHNKNLGNSARGQWFGDHGYAQALFFNWVDVTFTFGVFPKYLGPKWPTITWKWLKGSVWDDFLDPHFACFGTQNQALCLGYVPLQDKWNYRKWEPELVPLLCHTVLRMRRDAMRIHIKYLCLHINYLGLFLSGLLREISVCPMSIEMVKSSSSVITRWQNFSWYLAIEKIDRPVLEICWKRDVFQEKLS